MSGLVAALLVALSTTRMEHRESEQLWPIIVNVMKHVDTSNVLVWEQAADPVLAIDRIAHGAWAASRTTVLALGKSSMKVEGERMVVATVEGRPLAADGRLCSNWKQTLVTVYRVKQHAGEESRHVVRQGECDMFALGLQPDGRTLRFRTSSPFRRPRIWTPFDLPLESLLPSNGEMPNIGGQQLVVACFHCPLSVIMEFDHNGNVKYDGIEIMILEELARELNFTWRVFLIEDKNKWGVKLADGTYSGGMMGALTNGPADIGICAIWVSLHQFQYVDFAAPWGHVTINFLAPKSTPEERWRSIFLPFSKRLWISVAAVIPVQALAFWALSKLTKGVAISDSMLYTLGQLTVSHPGLTGRSWPENGLSLSMSVFSLMMASIYSGSIVSHLTLPAFTEPVDTVRQLVQLDYHWGKTYMGHNVSAYLATENEWHRLMSKRYRVVANVDELNAKVRKEKFVIAVDVMSHEYMFTDTPLDPQLYQRLRIAREPLTRFDLAIAFRKHSILTPFASRFLNRLKEAGIMGKWRRDTVSSRGQKEMKELFRQEGASTNPYTHSPLTLSNLMGAFYILAVGALLSTAACLLEVVVRRNTIDPN